MSEAVPTSGPAPSGRVLCRLEDIGDGQGKGFTLGEVLGGEGLGGEALGCEGLAARDIFVVRDGSRIYGYVNSCPHQGTPLDWVPDQFISKENGLIMCATHGAQFEWADGTCVSGPCAGASLEAVAVTVDENGRVVLDET